MLSYGTGIFEIKIGDRAILTGAGLHYELDLSDTEQVTSEEIALDGTRYTKLKGSYVNPVITVYNPTTNIQAIINGEKGKTVHFKPYNDNHDFSFYCTLMEATPIFRENTAVIIKIEIPLRSIGYVTFSAIATGKEEPIDKPVIITYTINDGSIFSGSGTVILNNSCNNSPTHYRASRYEDFRDTSWNPYSQTPSFDLYSVGLNRIYLQVKNAEYSSDVIYREVAWHGMETAEIEESVIVGNISVTDEVILMMNQTCLTLLVDESVEIGSVEVVDTVGI